MEKKLGMTSRGGDEEFQRVIANLLQQETHVIEAMNKEPKKAKELSVGLDNLRKIRQEVVKVWAGNKINPNHWCAVKHNLYSVSHLEECIENEARLHPENIETLNKALIDAKKELERTIKLFKSGEKPVEECPRCANDLITGVCAYSKKPDKCREFFNDNKNLKEGTEKVAKKIIKESEEKSKDKDFYGEISDIVNGIKEKL